MSSKIRTLALDPSGNFFEGKGTTGYAIAEDGQPLEVGRISASEFNSNVEYWQDHIRLIDAVKPNEMVIEGYRLYNHKGMKASTQSNSLLETPQLVGILTLKAYQSDIPLMIQFAKDVKSRWKDDILVAKNIIQKKGNRFYFDGQPMVEHEKDAIRHLMHFIRYNRGKTS